MDTQVSDNINNIVTEKLPAQLKLYLCLKSIRIHLPTEVVAVEYAYVIVCHMFT